MELSGEFQRGRSNVRLANFSLDTQLFLVVDYIRKELLLLPFYRPRDKVVCFAIHLKMKKADLVNIT